MLYLLISLGQWYNVQVQLEDRISYGPEISGFSGVQRHQVPKDICILQSRR